MGDISLVAQVVVFHNTRAFDQLVKKYQSPVRRFFLHQTCGDSELSDDLAQDTFIKAYTNIASFKNLSSFSTWLYRIAYNVFYDYIRSRKETDDLDTYRVDAQCSTLQQDVGQHMDIYRALATLKERNGRFGYVPSGRSMQHTAAGRGTAHGHLPCPGHTEGNGTHLHHALLHGRPKHRKDCRYHRMSGGNGKKPPLAGERQNGFLLKTKWL